MKKTVPPIVFLAGVLLMSQSLLAGGPINTKDCQGSYNTAKLLQGVCPEFRMRFPHVGPQSIYGHFGHEIESEFPGISAFAISKGMITNNYAVARDGFWSRLLHSWGLKDNSEGAAIFDFVVCVDPVKLPIVEPGGPERIWNECVSRIKRYGRN